MRCFAAAATFAHRAKVPEDATGKVGISGRCRSGARQIPARRLVAAQHTPQRDMTLIEMQERIVAMEAADELANLFRGRDEHRWHQQLPRPRRSISGPVFRRVQEECHS